MAHSPDQILTSASELLWTGALAAVPLVLAVSLVCRCRRLRPATRHMLWLAALASFVTPVLGSLIWRPDWFRSERVLAAADRVLPAAGTVPTPSQAGITIETAPQPAPARTNNSAAPRPAAGSAASWHSPATPNPGVIEASRDAGPTTDWKADSSFASFSEPLVTPDDARSPFASAKNEPAVEHSTLESPTARPTTVTRREPRLPRQRDLNDLRRHAESHRRHRHADASRDHHRTRGPLHQPARVRAN